MDLKARLQQLHEQHQSDLAAYAWASEADRWVELIFCILLQYSTQRPEPTRAAVAMLRELSLLDLDRMLGLADPNNENGIVFLYVLQQHGFQEDDAKSACRLLAHVAKIVQDQYDGKIQSYLRRYGNAMRDEIVGAFKCEAVSETQLRYAVSHWLQNALSLPVSLEATSSIEFCRISGSSLDDLWKAADDLDMNIALLDDLLQLHAESQQSQDASISTSTEGEA
jgi:hypothetical protein